MSLHREKKKDGSIRWVARTRVNGAGSKNIARYFSTKKDAEIFLHRLKIKKEKLAKSGLGIKDFDDTTFKDEAEFWIRHAKKKHSASHIKRMEGIFREILPIFGKLRPNKITAERLTEYQSDLLSEGLAPNTVNRKTEAFTSVLNFSFKNKRIPMNPSLGFSKLKIKNTERVNCWEKWEAQNFLDFANQKYPEGSSQRWVYLVYKTALNTGLRAGEIWGLQPQDFIQGGSLIFLQRQFNLVVKNFTDPKGGRSRRVPCNLGLRNELLSWINKNNLVSGETIFFNSDKNVVDHNNFVSRFFDKDIRESGVKRLRFHDLRHTAGTLMIDSDVPVTTVKEILGHQDLKTTMIYVHLLGSQIKKVAENFSIEGGENAVSNKLLLINTK